MPGKLLDRVGLKPAAAAVAGGGGGHRGSRRWRLAPGTSQQDGIHCPGPINYPRRAPSSSGYLLVTH